MMYRPKFHLTQMLLDYWDTPESIRFYLDNGLQHVPAWHTLWNFINTEAVVTFNETRRP